MTIESPFGFCTVCGRPTNLYAAGECEECFKKPREAVEEDDVSHSIPGESAPAATKARVKPTDKEAVKICLECPLKKCVADSPSGRVVLDLSTVSRAEVGRAVNCVPEHISSMFLGKTIPSLPLAYDIAQHLGVTLDAFYTAITGANGTNPRRIIRKKQPEALPPKYSVDGVGYRNLRSALSSIGIDMHSGTHYSRLKPEVQERIVRNRMGRGA